MRYGNYREILLCLIIISFSILIAWCHTNSINHDGEDLALNSTSLTAFATFTPTTFERIHLCVFHFSIAFFGSALCLPILIYAKNNAAAARFKLVNNFIVYICIVSLLFSFLQLGFGIRYVYTVSYF